MSLQDRERQLIDWEIYYGDGSTFSSLDGGPEEAPCGNVQRIAYYDEDGRRRQCHDKDYYIFTDGYWYGSDMAGLMQYLDERGFKIVKLGRMIADSQYRRISSLADNDFPVERK